MARNELPSKATTPRKAFPTASKAVVAAQLAVTDVVSAYAQIGSTTVSNCQHFDSFEVVRTMGLVLDIPRIREPVVGELVFENGDVSRTP